MLRPFTAVYYSARNRARISSLAAADLDSAEQLWGETNSIRAFRNVLVGPPEQRGETWQAWITSGDMEMAEDPLFYVLRQRSRVEGKKVDRWALFCQLDIADQNLHIHEDVFEEGVERARQATEACEADVAPIFVGCEESLSRDLKMWLAAAVHGKDPLIAFEESETSVHEVWPLASGPATDQVLSLFEEAPLFLLDGHHRLAAAKENHKFGIGDGQILACVCSMAESDTLILPIHRTVHYNRWILAETMFADLTRAGCRVSELPDTKVSGILDFLNRKEIDGPHCIALHSHSDKPQLVRLPVSKALPSQLARLPVASLDFEVLGQHPDATCIPVSSFGPALEQPALDQAQAAFFLPASLPSEVRAVALAKLKMPRKSTRFMPKPALGLICRPWLTSG